MNQTYPEEGLSPEIEISHRILLCVLINPLFGMDIYNRWHWSILAALITKINSELDYLFYQRLFLSVSCGCLKMNFL